MRAFRVFVPVRKSASRSDGNFRVFKICYESEPEAFRMLNECVLSRVDGTGGWAMSLTQFN